MSKPPRPIRLLLIDDHAVVRAGLSMLIANNPSFEVVGEAGNVKDALHIAALQTCDVILLDLDIGGESGLDLIPQLHSISKESKVLILTGLRDPEAQRRAIALGAMGIVLKEHASEALLKAIDCVYNGEIWLDRSMTAAVFTDMRQGTASKMANPEEAKIASLSVREREVIALIGEGLKNKDIASRLFLSETTVRHHLTSIFSKLDVTDRLELVIYAYRHHLITPEK